MADSTMDLKQAQQYEPFDSEQFRRDFFFRRRNGLLNWQQLISVDLESVVRNVDINALQDNIEHVTFADLRAEEFEKVNSMTLIQLFRLMQLMIEYLLNVQNYFMAADVSKDTYIDMLNTKLKAYKQGIKRKEEKAAFLKKELKSAKLLLKAYSKTSGGFGTRVQTNQAEVHQCQACSSSFINDESLQGHYKRRHPDFKANNASPQPVPAAGTRDIDFSMFGMGNDEEEPEEEHEVRGAKPPQRAPAQEGGTTRGIDVAQVGGNGASVSALRQEIADNKNQNEVAIRDQLSQFESNIKHLIEAANQQNQAAFVSAAGPLRDEDEDEKKADAHKKALDANNAVLSEIQEELRRLREENDKLRKQKDEVTNLYEPIIDERRQKEEEERLERLGQLLPDQEKKFTPFTEMPYIKSRFALPATRLKDLQGGLVEFVSQADSNAFTQLQYDIDKLGMRREEARIADELDFLVHEYYRPSQKLKERLQEIADIERAIAERKARRQGKLVGTSSEFRVPPRGPLNGKLTVTVVKGVDLVNRDMGEQDPYCILSVAKEKFQTFVHERGGTAPVWNQTFIFNVAAEEIEKEMLKLRVWDSDTGMDDSIGRADIPIAQMLTQQGKRLHTIYDGSNFKHSNGQIEMIVLFERDEAFFSDVGVEKLKQPPTGPIHGTLTLSVLRGVELRDRELVGQQDPYCIISTKTEKFKSRVHENGGKNPVWNQAFVFNVDTKEASKSGVKIVSYDRDTTTDDEIGRVTLSFTRLLSNLGTNMYLLGTRDKPAGQLELNVKWVPHPPVRGKLVVSVNAGHKLTDREFIGKQDPYCLLQLGEQKFKTSICKDGGKEPVWENESFEFYVDVKDAEKALFFLSCYDHDSTTDDLIGKTKLSLANLIENPGHRSLVLGSHTKNNGTIDVNVTWLGEGQAAKAVDAKESSPLAVPEEDAVEGKGLDDTQHDDEYVEEKLTPDTNGDADVASSSEPRDFGAGKLVLELLRGIELAPRDGNDPQDPYCIARVEWKEEGGSHFKEEFKTSVHEDGAAAPTWDHRSVFNLSEAAIRSGAVLTVDCWDEDVGADDLIGTTGPLLLSDVLNTRQGRSEFDIHTGKGDKTKPAGRLLIGLHFHEGSEFYANQPRGANPLREDDKSLDGYLYVTAKRGVDLTNREWRGKEDPYCILKIGKEKRQTPVHHKGGVNPEWNHSFVFPLLDCKDADKVHFKLSCWDHDSTTDDEIGHVEMTLAELLANHLGDTEITLGTSKRNDGKIVFNIQYHARSERPARAAAPAMATRDIQLEDYVEESDEEQWTLDDNVEPAAVEAEGASEPAARTTTDTKSSSNAVDDDVVAFMPVGDDDDDNFFLSDTPPPKTRSPPPTSSSATASQAKPQASTASVVIQDVSSDEDDDAFFDVPAATTAAAKEPPSAAEESHDDFVHADDLL